MTSPHLFCLKFPKQKGQIRLSDPQVTIALALAAYCTSSYTLPHTSYPKYNGKSQDQQRPERMCSPTVPEKWTPNHLAWTVQSRQWIYIGIRPWMSDLLPGLKLGMISWCISWSKVFSLAILVDRARAMWVESMMWDLIFPYLVNPLLEFRDKKRRLCHYLLEQL